MACKDEIPEGEYWVCIVGPAEREVLGRLNGADLPMRLAIDEVFSKVALRPYDRMYSGWGTSAAGVRLLLDAWHADLPGEGRSDD